jgi:hypothetical protein
MIEELANDVKMGWFQIFLLGDGRIFSRRAYVMVTRMNLRRLNIVQMIFKSLEIVYEA